MREEETERSGRNSWGSRENFIDAEKIRLQGVKKMGTEMIGDIKEERGEYTSNHAENTGSMNGRDMDSGIRSSEQCHIENPW